MADVLVGIDQEQTVERVLAGIAHIRVELRVAVPQDLDERSPERDDLLVGDAGEILVQGLDLEVPDLHRQVLPGLGQEDAVLPALLSLAIGRDVSALLQGLQGPARVARIEIEERAELLGGLTLLYVQTDPTTPPFLVANEIFGPSYISFKYVLSWQGVIPEGVVSVTSATCGKHRSAMFQNPLGTFRYMNVPANVFEIGVIEWETGDGKFRIASKEKAVCDKLFKICPMRSLDDIEALMFEDLRFDDDEILGMNLDLV